MSISTIKIELVEDWKKAYKWSSVRLAGALALLYGLLGTAVPALAQHWPEMAPFILKYFPTASEALGPFIGAVLNVLARVVVFRFSKRGGE